MIFKESPTWCSPEISIKDDSSLNRLSNPFFRVTKGIVYITCSDYVNTSYVFVVMDFSLAYNSAVYGIRTVAGRHTYPHVMLLTRGILVLINQHVSRLGVRKCNYSLKIGMMGSGTENCECDFQIIITIRFHGIFTCC